MVNNAVIMGRLTKDPEERKTNDGKSVCSFCVAVDSRFNKDKADFIDIVAYGKTAEFVCKYFRKGSMIAVVGRISTRMWEDKNGNKRKSTEITADNVSFCGDKKVVTYASQPLADVAPPSDDEDFREIPEDDLPF